MEESNNKMSTVKVVGFWVSLFTHRVRWALKLKGVDYEYIEEDIINKSPLLTQLNPVYGKVPVLVHDGIHLSESCIIMEYIDQIWSHTPLLPLDPYEIAQARFLAKFADEKILEPAWLILCCEGENLEKAVKIVSQNLEKVEEKLKGKIFFGGDTIGYLDFVMGFIAYILPVWEEIACVKILHPSKFPAIAAWINIFINHPVIRAEYLPPKDEIVSFYQWRRENFLPVYASYGQRIWSMLK